ncbi:unnamed protein product [[Actinomadura] parvosata subsp. kistnae]|uniref:hypothetical protein n=1 Tax=[Actinomadura] parvosata TaxID=1955412 RepID=UPI000D2813A7|nr:unnamed protein product [Actinomadura parvosata subsp. kistnae]
MFCVVLAGLLATLAAYVVMVRPTPAGPAAEAQAIGIMGRLHLSLSSVIKNHWKLVLKAGLIMSAAGVTLNQLTRDLPLMRSGIGEQARSAPGQRYLGPREGGHRRRPPGPLRHQRDQAVGSSSRARLVGLLDRVLTGHSTAREPVLVQVRRMCDGVEGALVSLEI